ncbi:MAG: ISAs1 family transposase, partial [Rhodobacter sp.]|nr:ISAs1 family transposase [Rhodobacter sp.]
SLGHLSSRGKGREIPDAMRLLETINLEGMIVTGDAIFCQKTITSRIAEAGGDYVLPVKRNQKDLQEEITTAFNEPVFPLAGWQEQPQPGHGRIDQRHIELLPAIALSEYMRNAWPTVRCIARVVVTCFKLQLKQSCQYDPNFPVADALRPLDPAGMSNP